MTFKPGDIVIVTDKTDKKYMYHGEIVSGPHQWSDGIFYSVDFKSPGVSIFSDYYEGIHLEKVQDASKSE